MPDTISLVLIKSFTYRGQYEEWTNKYHLTGSNPQSYADWSTLADAVIAREAAGLLNTITYERVVGYNAGSNISAFNIDLPTPAPQYYKGQLVLPNGMIQAPGDVALTVRWLTPDRSSRGKPIYLRKYFHGAILDGGADHAWGTQLTTISTNMAALADGTDMPGGRRLCGPQGSPAGQVVVAPYPTTRTLKRRGKNPTQ